MEYDSIDVASYITKYCASKNYFINITKLQKLLFCCYGAVLADLGLRLTKEQPKAWEHGPVFPRVYNYSKKQEDFVQAMLLMNDSFEQDVSNEILSDIQETVDLFGKYSASALINWTHKEGSPWSVSTNNGASLYEAIPDNLIQEYFAKLINKNDK